MLRLMWRGVRRVPGRVQTARAFFGVRAVAFFATLMTDVAARELRRLSLFAGQQGFLCL